MLDCQDGRALCLAKDGKSSLLEYLRHLKNSLLSGNKVIINEGDEFIVTEKSGQIKGILPHIRNFEGHGPDFIEIVSNQNMLIS